MHVFKITDENGDKFTYEASDMRAALTVHHMMRGTEAVKCKRVVGILEGEQ